MTDPSADQCLRGLRVLVTRPMEQAGTLSALILGAGGVPVSFPALVIEPLREAEQQALLERLSEFRLAVFVSANAVVHGLNLLLPRGFPGRIKIAAVGAATARALLERGFEPDCVPGERFSSEALLDLPEMNRVDGAGILIVRGEGGRELLRETLIERGARVAYLEVYRRVCPSFDVPPVLEPWVDAVTATSNDALDNLVVLLGRDGGRLRLFRTPLVVISDRMAAHARAIGFRRILLAEQPGDEAICNRLCAWARRGKGD